MDQVLGADGHIRYCAGCAREQPFEQPPCSDGHGDDCPERACVVCGHAVLVGLVPLGADPVGRSSMPRPGISGTPERVGSAVAGAHAGDVADRAGDAPGTVRVAGGVASRPTAGRTTAGGSAFGADGAGGPDGARVHDRIPA